MNFNMFLPGLEDVQILNLNIYFFSRDLVGISEYSFEK